MKINSKIAAFPLVAMSMILASCDNQDNDFPDYEGGVSVYFPYQAVVRTIVLGTEFDTDNSNDKAHKCFISATMGGSYTGRNINVKCEIDTTLCSNITANNHAVRVMPSNYYTLPNGTDIAFNGNFTGAIEVQLTDDFFNDPASVGETYVIPVVMRSQTGADRILAGAYNTETYSTAPARTDADSWFDLPMDYVLWCVNYKCKYDAYFKRTGKYGLNGGEMVQIPNKAKWDGGYDEFTDGEECNTVTKSLNSVTYAVNRTMTSTTDTVTIAANLLLTFDESEECTITSLTDNVKVTGLGKYTLNGAKKANNNKDRDLIELYYTLTDENGQSIDCQERLIWESSGVIPVNEMAIKYTAE